jgi:DnaJ like chaperone protein
MAWWGKALGGVVGLAVAGPLGALVGATLGHGLDRAAGHFDPLGGAWGGAGATDRARLKEAFFETTFSVMGHLAKSDGRVSETEIAFAESVMDRMALSEGLRRAAILFFRQGKAPEFDLAAALQGFRRSSAGQSHLYLLFLEIQMAAAYAEGEPTPAAREVLELIRRGLQIPLGSFRRVEHLIQIQSRILRGGAAWQGAGARPGGGRASSRPGPSATPLAGAYAILGVDPQASDAEVKRAYRKLTNLHHPDKLVARGAPEEALKMASQKTQEIRRAYETITRARAG